MPKYLPRPDLPPLVYDFLTERKYQQELHEYFKTLPEKSKGLKKLSVTTLSRSPRQRILEERYNSQIVIDPMERFNSMIGDIVHVALKNRARGSDFAEERIGMDIGPFPDGSYVHFHGQPDLFYRTEDKIVVDGVTQAHMPARTNTDYKCTKAWSIVKGNKEEYIGQLNAGKMLLESIGETVDHLKNIFFFLDWKPGEVHRFENYPKDKIVVVDVPVWDKEKTEQWVYSRIWEHIKADHLPDDELPFCTPEERWQSLPEYKVYKMKDDVERQKNAKFTCNSKLEAEEKMGELIQQDWQKEVDKNNKKKNPAPEDSLPKPKYIIRDIPSRPEKCFYCNARNFCNQYGQDVAKGYIKEEATEEE